MVLLLFIHHALLSQEDCVEELDKKTQKMIDGALNKKNDFKKRFDLMNEAVEYDENCLKCRMLLGEMYFKRAERNSRLSYEPALRQFQELSQQCPEYHADVWYYLGVINYGLEKWTSSKESFEKFMDFSVDDHTKLAKDHEKKMIDVEEVLPEIEYNIELFENPVEFKPIKIKGVSSQSDEYLPMLSPDNEAMFYTRKYQRKAKGDLYGREVEEFTWSNAKDGITIFDGGKALPAPFNMGDNYGGATISANNKEMYVTVCRPGKEGYNNCDIYLSTYSKAFNESNGKHEFIWSELENLGPNVNTDDGWESQPSLSGDGQTLYFATARATTIENKDGGKSIDIYYSRRGQDGSWGKAKSLGPVINGEGNEKAPFMHGDSKTLYFSSNGRAGVGAYDIYFSRLDENGKWSTPKNIGVPINTPQDEHGMIVSTDGSMAYYASSKIDGSLGFDIYGFDLPERAKPEKVLLVKGKVKDDKGKVINDARIELTFVESKQIREIEIDREDGSYATIVNVEREPVVMTIESDEHAFKAQLLNQEKAEDTGMVAELDLTLKEERVGGAYTIDDINYKTNSAEISVDSKAVLVVFARYLQKNPQLIIAIHGHTDNIGSDEDNKVLSTERAFEVMKLLQEEGVSADNMTFKGFGASQPIADNDTPEGRAENRRTEFVINSK